MSAVYKDEISIGQIEEFIKEDNVTRLKDTFALLPKEKTGPLLNCINELAATWKKRCRENGPERESLELRKEFAYLFLTPKGVYPYESVYRGKKNLLMDKPWEEVRNFYRRIGLEKGKNELHPEDHAAVELGLMAGLAFLSGRELPGTGSEEISEDELSFALQVQRDFLKKHLLQWVPRLCDDIGGKARHPFYRSVAMLAGLFLQADSEMLEPLCVENEKTF
ncbi:MAG: molecular chaperone TorD family protein [Bacillota bacterium]